MISGYNMQYIGYFTVESNNVVLCISDDISAVKYYLKKIRRLTKYQYTIREVLLDYDSVESLYGEYVLEEFNEEYLYLTRRDLMYISNEVDTTLHDIHKLVSSINDYRSLLEYGRNYMKYQSSIGILDTAIDTIQGSISKVKSIKRLSDGIIGTSVITSGNIWDYLTVMKQYDEDKELTDTFMRKLNEE